MRVEIEQFRALGGSGEDRVTSKPQALSDPRFGNSIRQGSEVCWFRRLRRDLARKNEKEQQDHAVSWLDGPPSCFAHWGEEILK